MGSAVDTLTTGSHAASPASAPKRNAIPHEVAVEVTGAKPGLDPSKRELFAESTTSVLAFENGGVIRLTADVSIGQLLFLTLVATKREVVAQVTRKHAFGAGYTEVEFTEPAPGFWGVDLPSGPGPLQSRPAESAPAAALRQAVEEAATESTLAPSLPSAEEVERLKSEVEALREQLESIKRQPSAPSQEGAQAVPTLLRTAKLASASQPGPSEAAPAPASVEPAQREFQPEQKEFAAQDLLPKAALDFSRVDAAAAISPPTQHMAREAKASGTLRQAVLGVALLGTVIGALWYGGFIPGFGRASSQPAKTAAAEPRPAVPKPASAAAPQKPAPAPSNPNAAPASNVVSADSPMGSAVASRSVDLPSASGVVDASAEAVPPAEPSESPSAASARHEKMDGSSKAEKRTEKHIAVGLAPVKAASDDDGDVVPPKLLQSVRAVPPPSAIRNFATGNVVLDAVVDSSGHVESSKVLSGPTVLRNAALNALKQYRYAPATQHGKAVEAHVQVTVQFWYEP